MKTKLTVGNLAERIARDNEKFAKARPATKRVIIAKDCLSRIRVGQITPITGSFCNVDYGNFAKKEDNEVDYEEIYANTSIKDVLNTTPDNTVVCESCAKGSLLMAYLGRVNDFTFNDLERANGNRETDNSHEKLLQIFSKEQLTLIETFFEGTQCIFRSLNLRRDHIDEYRSEIFNRPENIKLSEWPEYSKDVDKHYYYDSSDYNKDIEGNILMIEICKNIILNKGTFVLPIN